MTHQATADLPPPAPNKSRMVVQSAYIHRLQRRHFLYYDVLPPIVCVLLLALSFKGLLPTGAFEIGLLITFWLLTGLGITVGYHRLFTHRTFKASPALRKFLAITASMAGQGSVTSWVALHRLHHERSDQLGDPHSPNMHGVGVWNRMKGIGKIIKVSSRTVVAHAEVLVERAGERKLVAFALATIAKVEGK